MVGMCMHSFRYSISQSNERNIMHGHLIKVQTKPLKKYQVQISYFRQQMFDKIDDNAELDIENGINNRYEVEATSLEQAIARAIKVDTVVKAETMARYPGILPDEDEFDKETVLKFAEFLDNKGLFQDWILLEPTAIQASLIKDEDELNTLTENAVIEHTSHMSDEIEDFLRDTKE